MQPQDYEKQVLEKLSFLRPQRKHSKRKHFAIGLLLIAPFCLVFGFFPALIIGIFYKVLWIIFGTILLVVGAWQWDKSHKEEDFDDDDSDSTVANHSKSSVSKFRRVK